MIDRSDPQWYRDAVVYQLHIKAFQDANNDGVGDITGLINRLDYIHDLGVTAIWLLPFYPSPLKDGGYDLILFGRMATDTGSGTVGPMTAHLLDLPSVTAISHLELGEGRGTARRDLEGASETVSFPFPAVLTIDEGIARPRLATLKGIMAAKKKPLDVRPAQLGQVRLTVESMALPPERSGGRIVGEGADAVPELVRLLRTEAKVL